MLLLLPQPPEAVQLSASVLDQLSVVEPLKDTLGELIDKETVGVDVCADTLTATVSIPVPPVPVQFRIYELWAVRELMDCEPEVLLLPDQSPEAVQLSAFELDQLRVVDPLNDTLDGLADKATVGLVGRVETLM